MIYAIGKPGEEPRQYCDGQPLQDIKAMTRDDEIYLAISVQAGPHAIFSMDGKSLMEREPPLMIAQQEKLAEEALAARNVAWSGVVTAKGKVQTDDTSQAAIATLVSGAMAAKMLGQPLTISFKMADNTVVPLSADDMLALQLAVTNYLNACKAVSTAIRTKIIAAKTVEELGDIDVLDGYPA